jgi:two-component system response regulator EvgA
MNDPITVVCVDDHPLLRKAIRLTLKESGLNISLVAEGQNGDDALQLTKEKKPNILLLDVRMKQNESNQRFVDIRKVIEGVKRESPHTRIIIISAEEQPMRIQYIMDSHADGYLLKSDDLSLNIPQAIQIASLGGIFLSESIPRILVNSDGHQSDVLSAQQQIILQKMFDSPDMTSEQIADELSISVNTLRVHLARAREKLEAVNTNSAMVKAIRLGIIAV